MVRRVQRGNREPHPTKTLLLNTALELLEHTAVEDLTIDAVLNASGVSRGSLYHHYEDFPDLVEHALVATFAGHVDESIAALHASLSGATSRRDLFERLQAVSRKTQDPKRADRRMQRIVVFANTQNSERLRATLGVEQQRLTTAQGEIIAEAQSRGLVNPTLHPEAVAVFIQSYTLGRVVDDINPVPVPAEAWNRLIDDFVDNVVLAPEHPEPSAS
jgi:AcrR family transcriptional regulator